jgi:hypothetical protein
MRLKFGYTLVLIFCMSAFASSNECTRTCPEGHPRLGAVKDIPAGKPLASQREQPENEEAEVTPFLVIKFLYI